MKKFSLTSGFDLILDLKRSKSLVIEHLSHLSLIKSEVSPSEVSETYDGNKDHQSWVVSISMWVKWIITKLVSVRFIVNTSLLFKVMATWIGREDVLMMMERQVLQMSIWVVQLHASCRSSLHSCEGNHLLITFLDELVASISFDDCATETSN